MLAVILPIALGILLIAFCNMNRHQKELFFDCDDGNTYKLKFFDADNPFNDVACKVYKMKPNGKYKKVYSTYYSFSKFTNMKEMGKDAIANFILKEQKRAEYIKTQNEFWGD